MPPRRSALLLPALVLLPRPALAHALVISSSPSAGARLAALPGQVVIRFNSRIDHARSRVTLIGPDHAQLALELAPGQQPTTLTAPPPATPLVAGAWRLRWQVLAVDGHITRGDIPFTVTPP